MAGSTLKLINERARQELTGDDLFFKKFIYFFELKVPERLSRGNKGQFFFPIAFGPQQYSMSEPFTLEATVTEGGGLYIEESGIVMRTIRISGHTGFAPRKLPKTSVTALSALKTEQRSFGRTLPSSVLGEISGQRHFQYLQDAVFRTYADLKRDSSTSEDTHLYFHNPKDQESWEVAPRNFNLNRTSETRVLYPYDLELLVLGPAKLSDRDFSEDKGLVDSIKDTVRSVKSGIEMVSGAINDLTAIADEIERTVKGFGTIISSATGIIDAASNFVSGATDLISVPFDLANSVTDGIDSALNFVNTGIESGAEISRMPDSVINKFRQVADGIDRIGMHPEAFVRNSFDELSGVKQSQELLTAVSTDRVNEAAAADSPASYDEINALGTALTPGDVASARAELGVGRSVLRFTGATSIAVQQGDSLASLAARYLGDARLWQHIAVINGLKPPFVNAQANLDMSVEELPFSGALGIGSKILIPNFNRAPADLPVTPVLGTSIDESPEVHLLGTDLAMEPVGGSVGNLVYDVPVDTEGGSAGPKTVSGIDNITQSLRMRMRTEQGTDTMYRRVGLGVVIGSNFVAADLEAARLRIVQCLEQDQRVSVVRRVDFSSSSDDALVVDVDAELRGFTAATNVKAVL